MNKFGVIILIVLYGLLNAQDASRTYNNSAFVELGGAAGFLSGNYERLFFVNDEVKMSARAGVGVVPQIFGGAEVRIPITQSWIFGDEAAIEVGYGITLGSGPDHSSIDEARRVKWINFLLGIRSQLKGKRFLIRLGYTPVLQYEREHVFIDHVGQWVNPKAELSHWGGLSIGFGF